MDLKDAINVLELISRILSRLLILKEITEDSLLKMFHYSLYIHSEHNSI